MFIIALSYPRTATAPVAVLVISYKYLHCTSKVIKPQVAQKIEGDCRLQISRHSFVITFVRLKPLGLRIYPKLYTPNTLNIVLIQLHTHLNVCAVK